MGGEYTKANEVDYAIVTSDRVHGRYFPGPRLRSLGDPIGLISPEKKRLGAARKSKIGTKTLKYYLRKTTWIGAPKQRNARQAQ